MTDADAKIVRKAHSVLDVLRPEQKTIRELEVMAALRTVLTEPELARLIVLGLEALEACPQADTPGNPSVT